MGISKHALALQGCDYKVILADGVVRQDAFFKSLADRAASMAGSACGMRSGRALDGHVRMHYWIYIWNSNDPAGDPPVFFVTYDESEYTRIRDAGVRV